MKASVMMMILTRLTADSSGVCGPAPCSGQTFYRRIERRVNVRALRARTCGAVIFLLKYAKKPPRVPSAETPGKARGVSLHQNRP